MIGYWPLTREADALGALEAFQRLLHESRIRGMHAYGLAQDWGVVRAYELALLVERFDWCLPAVAHCRYSTSGDWQVMENNQPVVVEGTALVFNGCIHMGRKEEFEAAFGVQCETDNDGEIFLRLAERLGYTRALAGLTGSFAGCWLEPSELGGHVWTGRNGRRPLWTVEAFGARWAASTRDIFLRAGFPEPESVPTGVAQL